MEVSRKRKEQGDASGFLIETLHGVAQEQVTTELGSQGMVGRVFPRVASECSGHVCVEVGARGRLRSW